tara:strand:+ start:1002 stop:1502 length:501 start_codon:yes stop_codon:yes gene_type:complete
VYPINYYIALGTNIGNYKNNFSRAVFELKKIGIIVKQANIYQSRPYGFLKQNYFYNSMVQVRSLILPMRFMKELQLIEKKLQKNKKIKNGPRKIDLDIIFCDQKIINKKNLCIPHPGVSKRDFVLLPLKDIAPFFRHPANKKTIKHQLSDLKEYYVIKKLSYCNFV